MSLPRLRAPAEDGGVLAVPTFGDIGETIAFNRSKLDALPIDRNAAAAEAIAAAVDYLRQFGQYPPDMVSKRLVVAGHQPELFHPGVWLKNFALAKVVRDHGLTALNIIADTDTLKVPAIHYPHTGPSSAAHEVRLASLAFDAAAGEVPFEERAIRDRETFESFGERLSEATRDWPFESMGERFWPRVVAQAARTDNLGECLAAARRCVEREWGVVNLELPTSWLAQTVAFRSFVAWVLSGVPAFHRAHNECVAEYRRHHRIRSRNHPVPDLDRERGRGWIETPFWGWRAGAQRRGRLYARPTEGAMQFRVGGEPWPSVDPCSVADGIRQMEAAGFKIRPRALALTMFVRLYLADLFVHGIGGGRYDELTDAIIARFFRVTPPAYMVLTGTLRLPIPGYNTTQNDVRLLERLSRDLRWNPQRHIEPESEWASAVARHRQLATDDPTNPGARRQRFKYFRELKERLAPAVSPLRWVVESDLERDKNQVAANAVLRRRDFAFPLFPETMLRDWLTSLAAPPASPPRPTPP